MKMNKILLVLIIASGFLLIFYANNDIFTRSRNLLGLFQKSEQVLDEKNNVNYAAIKRVKYTAKNNSTEHNIFVIFAKENFLLRSKFELFLKSLLKYTSVSCHLHIITDEKSELVAEEIIKQTIDRYRKPVFYTLYDVEDSIAKIGPIVKTMMPYFSSNPGKILRNPIGKRYFSLITLFRIILQ